jgi:hypothetical protein
VIADTIIGPPDLNRVNLFCWILRERNKELTSQAAGAEAFRNCSLTATSLSGL